MNFRTKYFHAACMLLVLFSLSVVVTAQKTKREYVVAVAQGTSTQLGRMVTVTLMITDHSTPEDQAVLLAAFQEKGSEGVANALHKMSAKGRIAIPGTLGFDVNYIREFRLPDGSRKIRFVTDRPIAFGEAWSASRSMDYSLSMGEVVISKDKEKSVGTLIPAAQFTIDKEKELTVEAFQNPWKLLNVRVEK